jgi:hypothetical protein
MLYTLRTCENGKCCAEIFDEQGPSTNPYDWMNFNPNSRCEAHEDDSETLRLIPKHLIVEYFTDSERGD